MTHSVGDGIIVAALAAAIFGFAYLKHRERQRRLEIIHQERLVAMDKGIPLPELPLDPPAVQGLSDPPVLPILGVILLTLGTGAIVMLRLLPTVEQRSYWAMPLPLALMGFGLLLYNFLAVRRER